MDELDNLQNFLGDALVVETPIIPPVVETPVEEPIVPVVEEPVIVEKPKEVIEENDEDEFVAQVAEFKAIIGYEGDIEDFSVATIGNIVKEKISKVEADFNKILSDSEVLAFAEHKKNGGTLESFQSKPLVFDKSLFSFQNDAHVETLFTTYFKQIKGLDDDDVELAISALKSNPDIIEAKFNKVLDEIEGISNREIADFNKKETDKIEASKETYKKLVSVIDSGEYGTIKIADKKEVEKFKTYLNSELYNKKWEDIEKDATKTAIIEYLVYNDFNLDALVKNANVINVPKRNTVGLIKTTKEKVEKLDEFDSVIGMIQNM